MLACLPAEDIKTDKQEMEDKFSPIRRKRIETVLKNIEDELEATTTTIKYHEEIRDNLEKALKKFQELKAEDEAK